MASVSHARLRRLGVGVAAGVFVGLLVAALAWARPPFLDRGEFWTYDMRAARAAGGAESSSIVFIDINEDDISDVESNYHLSWPWPRALYGYLTSYATKGGARAIIFDFVFHDRGYFPVEDAEEFADAMREASRVVLGLAFSRKQIFEPPADGRFALRFGPAATRADAETLATRLLAWNVRAFVVGDGPATVFIGGFKTAEGALSAWERVSGDGEVRAMWAEANGVEEPDEAPEPPDPRELTDAELAGAFTARDIIRRRDAIDIDTKSVTVDEYLGLRDPLAVIARAPARMGSVAQARDSDGVMRRSTMFYRHDGSIYPSLPLAGFLVGNPDAKLSVDDHTLHLGEREIDLDDDGRLIIRFDRTGRYKHISAYEVLRSIALIDEGKPPSVPPELFKDKYIIVSAAAFALRDDHSSPVSHHHPGAEINANALENLLAGASVRRLGAGADAWIVLLLSLLAAFGVMAVWGTIRRPAIALVATSALGIGLGAAWWLLASWIQASANLWIPVVAPLLGIGTAAFAAILSASASERRSKRFVQEALGRYTSPALVAELTEHPEHLSLEWGEVREMSVYFSDIAGFTTISEALEPRKLVALLNEYLTSMTDIILAHDGVVDKYIGDAIMAFWGAPIPDKDHARKATECALAMRKMCDELRGDWEARYGKKVYARAGVNSGEAVVGNMGSKHKFNYTVMGDMVNLAARLEGANKPYGSELMISEYTLERVGDRFATRELDLLTVKGKEEPVRVFELVDTAEELDDEKRKTLETFAEGLARYRDREFAAAKDVFGRAAEAGDAPSACYVERCQHFVEEPPPDDWDGVWRLKSK